MNAEQYARAHHTFMIDVCNDLSQLALPKDGVALHHADLVAGVLAIHLRVSGYLRSVPPPTPAEDLLHPPSWKDSVDDYAPDPILSEHLLSPPVTHDPGKSECARGD